MVAVTPTKVIYTIQNAQGQIEQHLIRTNFVLWLTGIAGVLQQTDFKLG
jgi:hypothetical protein